MLEMIMINNISGIIKSYFLDMQMLLIDCWIKNNSLKSNSFKHLLVIYKCCNAKKN